MVFEMVASIFGRTAPWILKGLTTLSLTITHPIELFTMVTVHPNYNLSRTSKYHLQHGATTCPNGASVCVWPTAKVRSAMKQPWSSPSCSDGRAYGIMATNATAAMERPTNRSIAMLDNRIGVLGMHDCGHDNSLQLSLMKSILSQSHFFA